MQLLIIEDDRTISKILEQGFAEAGIRSQTVADGEEGLRLARSGNFDVLIVDVMLPGRDGISLVEQLRRKGLQTPVLFLSAKRSTEDRIAALQRGGDDYVVKPFSFYEVLARVQAIMRRSLPRDDKTTLRFSDLELDLLTRTAMRSGHAIELHEKEFTLLEYLIRNQERIVSKTEILGAVWEYDFDPQTNVVDVLVCRLRNKIDREFSNKLIRTFRGVGYGLRSD